MTRVSGMGGMPGRVERTVVIGRKRKEEEEEEEEEGLSGMTLAPNAAGQLAGGEAD